MAKRRKYQARLEEAVRMYEDMYEDRLRAAVNRHDEELRKENPFEKLRNTVGSKVNVHYIFYVSGSPRSRMEEGVLIDVSDYRHIIIEQGSKDEPFGNASVIPFISLRDSRAIHEVTDKERKLLYENQYITHSEWYFILLKDNVAQWFS